VSTTAGSRALAAALWVLSVLGVLMFLRTAYELLIPIAIGVLLSYALEPLVIRLEGLGIRRVFGAAAVVAVILGAALWGLFALRSQVKEAMTALPKAAQRVGAWLGADESAKQVQEVAQSPEFIERGVGWILSGAGHLTVIVFLVYFLLISREHFKRRFIELAGPPLKNRRITAEVLSEIDDQIQRFLLVTAFTSVVVGLSTWAVLAMMNVRQAVVWGLLAGVFNSIPYFGPVIVSGGLLVIGLLQFGEPIAALKISAASLAITSLEGWLLTPLMLGKAEHMHVVVVFLGVLLWTWLWGAWGTVLAVPMMVVVKSICDHVEPLAPVSRLLAP
jgi:predicted PurR-regulated permease PerM